MTHWGELFIIVLCRFILSRRMLVLRGSVSCVLHCLALWPVKTCPATSNVAFSARLSE